VAREAAFHDALFDSCDPADARPGAPDPFEQAILDAIGRTDGRTVLDYGCGDGTLGLHLAGTGAASVTGIDISPAAIGFAQARARLFCPDANVEFMTADVHSTGLPAGSFDVVAGKFVLHHLDFAVAVEEVYRLLAPGGRAVFVETSGLNPVLGAARRHIVHRGRFGTVKLGTADEHPLTRADLRLLRDRFPAAAVDYPNFWLWRVFDRNVLQWRYQLWTRRFRAWDLFVESRVPVLGPLSYYLRIVIDK
jgi:SAM-dependent methyltransferase